MALARIPVALTGGTLAPSAVALGNAALRWSVESARAERSVAHCPLGLNNIATRPRRVLLSEAEISDRQRIGRNWLAGSA